jgi:acetolactate synthase-1/2/3 large subunit
MNNSDLIVKILKQAGVTHGFGIPSGNVLPLVEAMRLGGMEFVLTAHEGSASFAADVMGRMTGRPGFCHSGTGGNQPFDRCRQRFSRPHPDDRHHL